VENVLGNLRKARADYETFVEGAEKGLSLRDPKIMAMHMYNMSSLDPKFSQRVGFDDVAKLAQNIQGKTYDQAQVAAKQQIREIQIRDQHPQIEAQPYQRQGP
jgi:ABC-type microcin C transport system duplicated ATPase subunit YejF